MEIYSLGAVSFDDIVEKGLYLEEEFKWLPIGQSIKYALAGNPVIMENPRSGRPLTIIAQEDLGWLTLATVLELKDLASLFSTTHALSLKNDLGVNETRYVRFKRDGYPLDLQPLDTAHRYFIGSIHLIEVT